MDLYRKDMAAMAWHSFHTHSWGPCCCSIFMYCIVLLMTSSTLSRPSVVSVMETWKMLNELSVSDMPAPNAVA